MQHGLHLLDFSEPAEPVWEMIFNDAADRTFARREWRNVIREMQAAQTLAAINGDAIGRLIGFRVVFERASRHVAAHGAVLPPASRKAHVGVWNPNWSAMRQADESIRALEAELGLSPLRRGRATKVSRKRPTARPADAYLRPVPTGEPPADR
ncbi:P27 family phage terminase small subunit [Hyphomicrobium sp. 1Nfss2.1]|uniref:P27 family phage terminase small subunit n=1 Tax=Hyphomicrobium sp. 1Nfss2.1 TaxID=3413936 RepID=UPI003C7BF555